MYFMYIIHTLRPVTVAKTIFVTLLKNRLVPNALHPPYENGYFLSGFLQEISVFRNRAEKPGTFHEEIAEI